jgi:hypothetical protein
MNINIKIGGLIGGLIAIKKERNKERDYFIIFFEKP